MKLMKLVKLSNGAHVMGNNYSFSRVDKMIVVDRHRGSKWTPKKNNQPLKSGHFVSFLEFNMYCFWHRKAMNQTNSSKKNRKRRTLNPLFFTFWFFLVWINPSLCKRCGTTPSSKPNGQVPRLISFLIFPSTLDSWCVKKRTALSRLCLRPSGEQGGGK